MCLKLNLFFSLPKFVVCLFPFSYIIVPPFPWSLSLEISGIIFNSSPYLSHLSSPISSTFESHIHPCLCTPSAFYLVGGITSLINWHCLQNFNIKIHSRSFYSPKTCSGLFHLHILKLFWAQTAFPVSFPIFSFNYPGSNLFIYLINIYLSPDTVLNSVDIAVDEISHSPCPSRDCTLVKTLLVSQLLIC